MSPLVQPEIPVVAEVRLATHQFGQLRTSGRKAGSRKSSSGRTWTWDGGLADVQVTAATQSITSLWRDARRPACTELERRTFPAGFWSWACEIHGWWPTETSLWSPAGTGRRRGQIKGRRRRKAQSRTTSTPSGEKKSTMLSTAQALVPKLLTDQDINKYIRKISVSAEYLQKYDKNTIKKKISDIL